MFEKAKWIWKNQNQIIVNDYGWFVKEFDVVGIIDQGKIRISAHNYMKVFINGILISGFVTPATSVASRTKLYLEYDITNYLKQGVNQISVVVLYLGGNGQNYVNSFPGLICEGFVNTSRGIFEFNTDESWNYFVDIPYMVNMPYQENRRITPVELYDSRIELNCLETVSAACSILNSMNINLIKQEIPEGGIHEVITPKLIAAFDNVTVFDAGRIVTGFVKYRLKGIKDLKLTVRYSEDFKNNRVKHNVANETSEYYFDQYIMRENDVEMHQADFTYKSFRYFEIENYPVTIDPKMVEVLFASTAVKMIGSLESKSYPIINQLAENIKNTHLNNIQGILVDCPHREQAQYLGDSFLQAENLFYNFTDADKLIAKVLKDFKDSEFIEGHFPFVAPVNNIGTEFNILIPEYDLFYVLILNELFSFTKNKNYLTEFFDTAKKVVDYYSSQIDDSGLLIKDNNWHISDWPYPTVNQEGKYLTVQNLLLYKSMIIIDKLSHFVDEDSDYGNKAENLKQAIRKHLIKNGLLEDSYQTNSYHQGVNALGLEYHIFDKEEVKKVLDFIVSKGFSSKVILGRSVLKSSLENGLNEFAFNYMFDFEQGWGNILKQGWLTMWEGFEDIESHSHAWNTYPFKMIQYYIAGVQINKDDPKMVLIKPGFVKRIKDIKTKVNTIFGVLEFGYFIKDKTIILEYFIPKGIKAELDIFDQKYQLGEGLFSKMEIVNGDL